MAQRLKFWIISIVAVTCIVLITPLLLAQYISMKEGATRPSFEERFPVTVDPVNKTITEDAQVNAYLESQDFSIQATTLFSSSKFEEILVRFAIAISQILENNNLALVSSEKFVTITAGLRKEEVANKFTHALGWSDGEKKEFMTIQEGLYFPGIYAVVNVASPNDVKNLVNERFALNVLSRYGTSTAEIVPLNMALTIASLIERETIGTEDMRIISGIIWNRIFAEMNLQLDATLQYAKATNKKTPVWWSEVRPQDKFIKSPYNTYIHGGLPPTPIANPSVAAIIAALNPLKTACMFYFHDEDGGLHCTPTYKEHVALLKQYYGRGR